MAQLYQCSVSDLVVDLPDYRHQDSAPALALADATRAAAKAESLLVDLVGTVHTEVARFESDGGDSQERHFYQSEAVFWATMGMGNCALRLGEPDRALDAISKSLVIGDPTYMHNRSFGLLSQTEAFIQKNEITEASRIIGAVAARTVTYTSARIDQRITEPWAALSPWQASKPVPELDDVLATYRRSPSSSNSL